MYLSFEITLKLNLINSMIDHGPRTNSNISYKFDELTTSKIHGESYEDFFDTKNNQKNCTSMKNQYQNNSVLSQHAPNDSGFLENNGKNAIDTVTCALDKTKNKSDMCSVSMNEKRNTNLRYIFHPHDEINSDKIIKKDDIKFFHPVQIKTFRQQTTPEKFEGMSISSKQNFNNTDTKHEASCDKTMHKSSYHIEKPVKPPRIHFIKRSENRMRIVKNVPQYDYTQEQYQQAQKPAVYHFQKRNLNHGHADFDPFALNRQALHQNYLNSRFLMQKPVRKAVKSFPELKSTHLLDEIPTTRNSTREDRQLDNPLIKIGSGAYGNVYKRFYPALNKYLAVKIILKAHNPPEYYCEEFEAIALQKLNHLNIVNFHSEVNHGMERHLIMDFVEFNLSQFLGNKKLTKYFMRQLITGVKYIHSHEILHRDLKPQNILVTNDLILKIADFGMSCMISDGKKYKKERTYVTYPYRAPELFFPNKVYSYGIDIYSIGIIAHELYTARLLIPLVMENEFLTEVFRIIGNKRRFFHRIQSTINNQEIANLIMGCCLIDQKERFTIEDAERTV